MMIMAATGLGKARMLGAIAADLAEQGKTTLIVAHRRELVDQLVATVELVSGISPAVEMAERRIRQQTPIMVGSIDSLRARLSRGLKVDVVMPDELHHYAAKTWKETIKSYGASIVGCTATPKRLDGAGMKSIVDKCVFKMGIQEGIKQGYLVPVKAQSICIKSIQLDNVPVVNGDLQASALEVEVVKGIEAIVQDVLRRASERKGICFWPGIKSAELAAERFRANGAKSAALSNRTSPGERKAIIAAFRKGEIQYLNNVMVLGEGFDCPDASLIVMARPTQSVAVFTQALGRCTRTVANIDAPWLANEYAHAERRAAIAVSAKPDMLFLDYAGVTEKHDLVTPADVLGEPLDKATRKAVRKEMQASGKAEDPMDALFRAKKAMTPAVKAQLRVSLDESTVDLFSALSKPGHQPKKWFDCVSAPQFQALSAMGFTADEVNSLDRKGAKKLLDKLSKKRKAGLSTWKQVKSLVRYGADPRLADTASITAASKALDYLSKSGWRMGQSKELNMLLGEGER